MKQTERIEDFGRFLPAKASPESAMASRIERSIEPTVGTAIASDLIDIHVANPTIAPTMEWVVETGQPFFDAISNQVPADSNAASMP